MRIPFRFQVRRLSNIRHNHLRAAYAPNAVFASLVNLLAQGILISFCGVLVPYAQLQMRRWWSSWNSIWIERGAGAENPAYTLRWNFVLSRASLSERDRSGATEGCCRSADLGIIRRPAASLLLGVETSGPVMGVPREESLKYKGLLRKDPL